jgi:hypothetical protein
MIHKQYTFTVDSRVFCILCVLSFYHLNPIIVITLSTLAQATAQEVFDQAYIHLLTQNEKSINYESDTGTCLYRGPNGLKCAVGCFIAEDEYTPKIEKVSWSSIVVNERVDYFAKKVDVNCQHNGLLKTLQNIHDETPVTSWKVMLQDTAITYNLTCPELPL